MKNFNPYDLLNLSIDGVLTYGRPYQFDSEISDSKNSKNSKGNYVKPTKISTTCPKCGGFVDISIELIEDPPFKVIEVSCAACNPQPKPTKVFDPFFNPLESGDLHLNDLDPLIIDVENPIPSKTQVIEEIVPPVSVKIPAVSQPDKKVVDKFDLLPDVPNIKKKSQSKPLKAPKIDKELNTDESFGDDIDFDDLVEE